MKPSKIEFEIGRDTQDRRVVLTAENDMRGKQVITITSHAGGQRDDTQAVRGLSIDNLKLIAETIKNM